MKYFVKNSFRIHSIRNQKDFSNEVGRNKNDTSIKRTSQVKNSNEAGENSNQVD